MTLQKVTVNLLRQDKSPRHLLGELHISQTDQHYRYMQADGAVTANVAWSYRPNTWQIEDLIEVAVTPATAESVPFCVSAIAITDNYYAWVFIGPGVFTATAAANIAADAILYGHATAGEIDDAATACLLRGVIVPAAITGNVTGTFYATKELYAIDLA